MGGIAAIIRFDGAPVVPGSIERVAAEMAYRGRDGTAFWHGDGAALAALALHTTAAVPARIELGRSGTLAVLFDGYLHYRDDLIAALGPVPDDASDAALAMRAFELWGEDCVARLEGEFALLAWDTAARRASLIRDHAGLKPLHFWFADGQLVVASDPGAVLVAPGVRQEHNMAAIVQIMANEWIDRGQTVWKGIERQLPATVESFDGAGRSSRRYWMPPLSVSLRYRNEADYAEHYLEVLRASVREASRSAWPVACEVSGGLDSSAVFAVAMEQLRAGQLRSSGVKGYTYRFPQGTDADELIYARAVADFVGAPIAEVEPSLPSREWFVERARLDRDFAQFCNSAMMVSIAERLRADGCRVCLNGEGGDEWLAGRPTYYAEHFAERDFAGLARSLRDDCRELGFTRTVYRAAAFGAARNAPLWMRRLRRRLLPARGPNHYDSAFWLDPALDRLLAERRAARDWTEVAAIPNPARRAMLMTLTDPCVEAGRDIYDRQTARDGYETRAPLYSRRFIEFAFSIPERQRLQADRRKAVHVAAMKGMLPELVRNRTTKADFSVAFEYQLEGMEALLTEELPAASTNILSRDGMKRLFRLYREQPVDSRPVWELWGIFCCVVPLGLGDEVNLA